MSTTSACALALVVVLVLIIAGVLAAKSRGAPRFGERFSAAAAGSQAPAVAQVKRDVTAISRLSGELLRLGGTLGDQVSVVKFKEVEPSIRVLNVPFESLSALLSRPTIPPSSLQGVYEGLDGGGYARASRMFERSGGAFEKIADAVPMDAPERDATVRMSYMLRDLSVSVANLPGSVQMLRQHLDRRGR